MDASDRSEPKIHDNAAVAAGRAGAPAGCGNEKCLAAFAGQASVGTGPVYLLLLLPVDFFSPPWLLRLLLPPLLAWLRSLWVSLLPLLDMLLLPDMLPPLPLLFDDEDFD